MEECSELSILTMDVVEKSFKDPTFASKWKLVYKYNDDIRILRLRCSDFLSKDEKWLEAFKYIEDMEMCPSDTDMSQFEEQFQRLYHRLIRAYETKCKENENKGEWIIMDGDLMKLKNKYDEKPSELIRDLVRCLTQETKLLQSVDQEEEMDVSEANGVIYTVQMMEKNHKDLKKLVKEYEDLQDQLMGLEERKAQIIDDSSLVYTKQLNGFRNVSDFQAGPEIQHNISDCKTKLEQKKQLISDKLTAIAKEADTIQQELKKEITQWKTEQKMFYVDLAPKPSLPVTSQLENWCPHAGQILFELLGCTLDKLSADTRWADLHQTIQDTFDSMMQWSFIVTDQVKNTIKVSMGTKKKGAEAGEDDGERDEDSCHNKKFTCPKFKATVRLLATGNIDSVDPVKAYFVHEDSLSHIENAATDKLPSNYPFKGKKGVSFCSEPLDKGTANFKTLELNSFNRDKDCNVAQEKFRIMFRTKLKVAERTLDLWTMSLPIVIITGASQQCNACGSLLWQCLNPEDQGQFPPPPCPLEVPWSRARDLLETKIRYLGGRGLTQDEERNLASRITEQKMDHVDDDLPISFKKFCIDKLMDINDPSKKAEDRKKSATFWMWFQAVFNLLKTHLKDYWQKDLIQGFLDKDHVERCLKNSKPNAFLLRFSNNIITDAQGQNMCGAISVSYRSGSGNVDHMMPLTSDDLRKCDLAHTLKKMIHSKSHKCEMQYCYPTMTPREEAYKDFLTGVVQPPKSKYQKFIEMFFLGMDDLEDGMSDLTTRDDRPKKRAVHKNSTSQTGSQGDSKVAKITPFKRKDQGHEKDVSVQEPGSVTPDVPDVPQGNIPWTVVSCDPVKGLFDPTIPLTTPAQAFGNTAGNQPSRSILDCPTLKMRLKSKLQNSTTMQCAQGSVDVNNEIARNQAEAMMESGRLLQQTIAGGNDGFARSNTNQLKHEKKQSSSSDLAPLTIADVKQSGSPQTTILPQIQGDPSLKFWLGNMSSQCPSQNHGPSQILQGVLPVSNFAPQPGFVAPQPGFVAPQPGSYAIPQIPFTQQPITGQFQQHNAVEQMEDFADLDESFINEILGMDDDFINTFSLRDSLDMTST